MQSYFPYQMLKMMQAVQDEEGREPAEIIRDAFLEYHAKRHPVSG